MVEAGIETGEEQKEEGLVMRNARAERGCCQQRGETVLILWWERGRERGRGENECYRS